MIKSVKIENPQTETYPVLMEIDTGRSNAGTVVLFYSAGEGVVVHSTSDMHPVGKRHQSWDMDHFIRYQGSVTLQNA